MTKNSPLVKAIPDGIGATVKKAVDCIISSSQEQLVYCMNVLISIFPFCGVHILHITFISLSFSSQE